MKVFDNYFISFDMYTSNSRKPDFNNILKVMKREKPDRPTLFEFFMNDELYLQLAGIKSYDPEDIYSHYKIMISAFKNAGYDYTTVSGSDFIFPSHRKQKQGQKTISINEGGVIFDRETFENYHWLEPEDFDYSRLKVLKDYLPAGMKLIVSGPGGVLENAIALTGYENLCYIIKEDPDLAEEIFDAIGSRLVRYYQLSLPYETVGAAISNDDWGFISQTMLSTEDMRKYVIPWHKKIAAAIHDAGKPAILHSCGNLEKVMDDIIDVIGYDAKHSYEDKIMTVEEAYKKYGDRIAILGGIDVDFLCRHTPQEVYERSAAILEMTAARGGYALGSGNSIPYFVPETGYLAMIAAVQ
jgi:uroporphyrinogen decarboxylase